MVPHIVLQSCSVAKYCVLVRMLVRTDLQFHALLLISVFTRLLPTYSGPACGAAAEQYYDER